MKIEKAFTVAEVASMTGFSRQTITRLFEHEEGVLILKRPEKLHKKSYRSIRIPPPVFKRVVGKMTV